MAPAGARAAVEDYMQLAYRFWLFFTPALVLCGTLGNLLSIYVFYKSKLKTHTTSQYLTALAVSDTLFLLQLLPAWFDAVQETGIFYKDGFCQLFVYTSYVCSFISSWLVVAFTVERFVAVLHPMRRARLFTPGRVRWIIGALVGVALAFNLPVLQFATAYSNDCEPKVEYYAHAARFNLIDTVLTFSVPLLVIVVLNGWIMGGVLVLERARTRLHATGGGALYPLPRSQQRVTRMLLTVSTVFVFLNLPAYTMRIYYYAHPQFPEANLNETYSNSTNWEEANSTQGNSTSEDSIANELAAQNVASIFFNTNFGINFLLYCLSGQNFRRALRQIMPNSANMTDDQKARQARTRSVEHSGHRRRSLPALPPGRRGASEPAPRRVRLLPRTPSSTRTPSRVDVSTVEMELARLELSQAVEERPEYSQAAEEVNGQAGPSRPENGQASQARPENGQASQTRPVKGHKDKPRYSWARVVKPRFTIVKVGELDADST